MCHFKHSVYSHSFQSCTTLRNRYYYYSLIFAYFPDKQTEAQRSEVTAQDHTARNGQVRGFRSRKSGSRIRQVWEDVVGEKEQVLKRPEQQPDDEKWGRTANDLLATKCSANNLPFRTPFPLYSSQPDEVWISLLKSYERQSQTFHNASTQISKMMFQGGMKENRESHPSHCCIGRESRVGDPPAKQR